MIRLLTIIPFLALIACASPTATDSRPLDAEAIVWPEPPETPRIAYRYSFEGPADLGIRPRALARLVQLFAGRESDGMSRPYAVAADDEMICVIDGDLHAVHLFMPGISNYSTIRPPGDQGFISPVGIDLGEDAIFVSDSTAGKVFVFSREGELAHTIEGLGRPTGIAFHRESKRLYVVDTANNNIVFFDEQGEKLGEFGKRGGALGQFNFPTFLSLSGETLFVNDTLNYRIQALTLDGVPIDAFGEIGDGSGQFALSKGVGIDADGHIYVADALSNYIQIFDRDGRFLLSFGGMGGEAGQFMLPAGVYVFNNTIYVADSRNGRVQVFEYVGGEES